MRICNLVGQQMSFFRYILSDLGFFFFVCEYIILCSSFNTASTNNNFTPMKDVNMGNLELYKGYWPKAVAKTAKYSVHPTNRGWEITVYLDLGQEERALVVEGSHKDIIDKVNEIKTSLGFGKGGAFYINEYQHLLVPVQDKGTSRYYYGGKFDVDFRIYFEGKIYSSEPTNLSGDKLKPRDQWIGPRPGIPYTLAAGGFDIRYYSHIFTNDNPPKILEGVKKKVSLLKVCSNKDLARENIEMIRNVKGNQGGRFYVNERLAAFAPIIDEDEDEDEYYWKYVYCGNITLDGWFPEPHLKYTNN